MTVPIQSASRPTLAWTHLGIQWSLLMTCLLGACTTPHRRIREEVGTISPLPSRNTARQDPGRDAARHDLSVKPVNYAEVVPSERQVETFSDPVFVDEIPTPMCASKFAAGWRPTSARGVWPKDEYLCDGGDRLGLVEIHNNGQMVGVDQQDTIAHVRTRQGEERIVPSNCVCIYSPRFAAVRHLDGIHVSDQRHRLSSLDQPEETLENMQRDVAATALERDRLIENLKLQPPIAAKQLDIEDHLIDRRKLTEQTWDLRVLQHVDLLTPEAVHDRQRIDVASAVQAAITWTDETAVQVLLEERMVQAEGSYAPAEQTYQYRIPPGQTCLQLIKLASCGHAQPGDEVEFLLQFRNTGPDALEQVTLVDNLTTRLEYVADSQECSLKSTFAADDNQADTHVLRWTLTESLLPGEGGVIHFRCRVR